MSVCPNRPFHQHVQSNPRKSSAQAVCEQTADAAEQEEHAGTATTQRDSKTLGDWQRGERAHQGMELQESPIPYSRGKLTHCGISLL